MYRKFRSWVCINDALCEYRMLFSCLYFIYVTTSLPTDIDRHSRYKYKKAKMKACNRLAQFQFLFYPFLHYNSQKFPPLEPLL